MNTQSFRACRIHKDSGTVTVGIEEMTLDQLSPGDVVIRVHYSSVNYKDALAATGRGNILRAFPMNGGVDAAGVVVSSGNKRWIVPLPEGLSLFDAMALGTAGFTAALAIDRLEQNGQQPGQGAMVVTGASGGVGSVAIDLLSAGGYEVVAMTRKKNATAYLEGLGAASVSDYEDLISDRPLQSAQWGGAIDSVGGKVLAGLISSTRPWGNIASIGMAGGSECHTTVMPFILRGVSVLGITSANCPMERRLRVWQRLVSDLQPGHLQQIVAGEVSLDDLPAVFERLLQGEHHGRFVVKM
jgi:NADPH2:quinone reductase